MVNRDRANSLSYQQDFLEAKSLARAAAHIFVWLARHRGDDICPAY